MNIAQLPLAGKTRLTFRWRSIRNREGYVAICQAVRAGYDTRDVLLAALPQFSHNRLLSALDSLLGAGMAWIERGSLVVSEDMHIIETLADGKPLGLPIAAGILKPDIALQRELLSHLGLRDPDGALSLLSPKFEELPYVA